MPEHIKVMIEEQVQLQLNSKTQTIETMIGSLMKELKEHNLKDEERHQSLITLIKKIDTDTLAVREWFVNINFTKQAALWILGFIATIAGILLTIKQLIK